MEKVNFIPVLLGSDVNVYGMARSFHEAYGVCSLAIGKGRLPATANSRIVKVMVAEPNLEDDHVFCETLIAFAKRFENDARTLLLVSCGDNYSKLLSRNEKALRPYYAFHCIDEALLSRLSVKENFYQVCEECGLSYPKTAYVTSENYKHFVPPFSFPVIVKPSNSIAYWNCSFAHKKKVFLAKDKEEFDKILDAIYSSSYQDALIIQDYIIGDDSHMRVLNCYSDSQGKVKLISLGNALLEEHTPEGIGSYAAIISGYDEALSEKIQAFLNGIGYRGFSNFDMKFDVRDGSYKFFEMNPRQGRSSFFVTAAGCNMAKWLVEDLVEHKELPVTISKEKSLWTLIPKDVLFTYLPDGEKKEEAKELYRAGKVCHSLFYKKDIGLRRLIFYFANQRHYREKYKKYFGKKGFDA